MASYLRPTRLADALAALAAAPRTIIAGATDHYPARVTFEPMEDVLDVSAITALRAIALQHGTWRIPALATWSDIAGAGLPPLFAGLRHAATQVGGRQIQNAATLLGNVCNASPAADGIPCLLALDAAVELRSTAGVRTLALPDFILGPRHTARRPDELATALLIPDRDAHSTFRKLGGRSHLVISITMAALTIAQDEAGRVTHAAIAVGACGPRAVRLPVLEAALLGRDPAITVTPEHLAALTPIDDLRASAAYRRDATRELLQRALVSLAPRERTGARALP